MYIEPSTKINLLMNIPIDREYRNTLFFESSAEQYNYFWSHTVKTFTEQTYQRRDRGYVRLQCKISDVYKCNYMMFQNALFENKWFYAFIIGVEYINNNVTEIHYEIDVMQTWYFDYNLKECFVEREHSTTDEIGDNIVPEDLDLGDYIYFQLDEDRLLNSVPWCAVLVASETDGAGDGEILCGSYTGVKYASFRVITGDGSVDENGVNDLNNVLSNIASDRVVTLFMFPYLFTANLDINLDLDKTKAMSLTRSVKGVDNASVMGGLFGGYPVKNKKLYTYPYNFMYITTGLGENNVVKYEYWSKDSDNLHKLKYISQLNSTPELGVFPLNYRGVSENIEECVYMKNFPLCPYVTDTFTNWFVNNQGNLLSSVINTGVSFATNQVALGGIGASNTITGLVNNMLKPDTHHNTVGNNNILMANKLLDFNLLRCSVNTKIAEQIDNYFTMYGYATNKVKVPNQMVRTRFTYTKTHGCIIDGLMPADDVVKICNIYDNGITFWRDGTDVGNYSDANSVLSV